jgi:hypothetical protein
MGSHRHSSCGHGEDMAMICQGCLSSPSRTESSPHEGDLSLGIRHSPQHGSGCHIHQPINHLNDDHWLVVTQQSMCVCVWGGGGCLCGDSCGLTLQHSESNKCSVDVLFLPSIVFKRTLVQGPSRLFEEVIQSPFSLSHTLSRSLFSLLSSPHPLILTPAGADGHP